MAKRRKLKKGERIPVDTQYQIMDWCPYDVSIHKLEWLGIVNEKWEEQCDETLKQKKLPHLIDCRMTKLIIASALDCFASDDLVKPYVRFRGLGIFLSAMQRKSMNLWLSKSMSMGESVYGGVLGTTVACAMEAISKMPPLTMKDIEFSGDPDDPTAGMQMPHIKTKAAEEAMRNAIDGVSRLPSQVPDDQMMASATSISKILNNAAEQKHGNAAGGRYLVKHNPGEIIQVFSKNVVLQAILRAIGGGIAEGERKRERKDLPGIKPHGMGYGDDIFEATEQHIFNFLSDDPELQILELDNISARKLVQLKRCGVADTSGHVICMVDTSGSMNGDPFIYAKAAMGALAIKSLSEGKRFHAIIFSSSSDIRTFEVTDLASMIEACEFSFGGGTDFEAPIHAALKLHKRHYQEMDLQGDQDETAADLIMITDGYCDVDPKFRDNFLETKKKLDVKFHCFYIGCGIPDGCKNFSATVDMSAVFEPNVESIGTVLNVVRSGNQGP